MTLLEKQAELQKNVEVNERAVREAERQSNLTWQANRRAEGALVTAKERRDFAVKQRELFKAFLPGE